MRQIIEKFITKLADKKGYKIFKLEYKGKGISLNDIYAQGHWRTRHNIKKKYKPIFEKIIDDCCDLEFMSKFSLWIFYNSRHDPDNIIGMEKMFVDSLRGDGFRDGFIFDDNKKFFRGVSIFPDETLETNTFQFYLMKHE